MKTKILAAVTGSGKTSFAAAAPYANQNGGSPQDYHLPSGHLDWRPHQLETLQWLTSGIGRRTMALCRTKNLQVHQYAEEYGFDYLTGRSNWSCVHSLNPGATAEECLYNTQMNACEYKQVCPYLRQKHLVQNSNLASLNYAYYLVSRWPCERFEEDPDAYLFLDECHEISELIIGFVSITITKHDRKDYGLPSFPRLSGKSVNKLLADTQADMVKPALAWLSQCLPIMKSASLQWNQKLTNERIADNITDKTRKMTKRTDNLLRKIEGTLQAISENRDDWYIKSGPNSRQVKDRRTGKMRSEPAFVARPLTARHFYKHFFEHGQQNVLMSATIGDVKEFTAEIGLSEDEYEFMSVPNQFGPETRPIYILDTPSMGAKKSHESWKQYNARFDEQARVIARSILDCPSHWPGMIHVTRKTEAKLLAERLSKHGLGARVWPSTGAGNEGYTPTDIQVLHWQQRKRRVPNSIGIFWSLWEGYNGLSEKINVICKAPFPVYGSPGSYEEAHRKYSGRRYRWATAVKLAQAVGRTRRGRLQDYDTPTEKRGFVAIADRSYSQCQRYLPQDILDAIVKL